MTLGGAAQVAAAHCQNKQTLDPAQSAAITDPLKPQPAALWPSPRNVLRQRLAIGIVRTYKRGMVGCVMSLFQIPRGMFLQKN